MHISYTLIRLSLLEIIMASLALGYILQAWRMARVAVIPGERRVLEAEGLSAYSSDLVHAENIGKVS